ncbi:hypothetical protein DRZ78_01165, partial [Candidatus Aerophobetes bacterium]
MLIKKKRRLFYGGLIGWLMLIVMILVCSEVPVKAQEPLEKQLAEAKAAIADQIKIIGQLKDNFFKVTAELSKEIENLKAKNAEQAKTIKQITDNYFKVTGELKKEIESLEAANSDL